MSGEVKAQLVHGLLESEGIESYMKGEAIRYVHGFSLGRLGLVRMMVRAEDEQRARDVLNSAQDDWEDSGEEGPKEYA